MIRETDSGLERQSPTGFEEVTYHVARGVGGGVSVARDCRGQ